MRYHMCIKDVTSWEPQAFGLVFLVSGLPQNTVVDGGEGLVLQQQVGLYYAHLPSS